jgi:acetolactate synthase I/II/III large subunit
VLAVESRADLPRLEAALRAPGPLAAVVRTSLGAVLPPAMGAPE